ncbi:hypothetical protein [Cardinium endosymbiont of Tipula unca]|uniref:hypothetical protein n=1 Tax=Cardinium endosymbiont of Tipula unca TaxID=3066216 RepID=UPI0030D51979
MRHGNGIYIVPLQNVADPIAEETSLVKDVKSRPLKEDKGQKLENEQKNIQEPSKEEMTKCIIAEAEKCVTEAVTNATSAAEAEKYATEAATNATSAAEVEKYSEAEEEKNRTDETEKNAANAKKYAAGELIKARVAADAAEAAKWAEGVAEKYATKTAEIAQYATEVVKTAIAVTKYAIDPSVDLNILTDKEKALAKQKELLTQRIAIYQTEKRIKIKENNATTSQDQEVASGNDPSSMATNTENSVPKTERKQNVHHMYINSSHHMRKVSPNGSPRQLPRSQSLDPRQLLQSRSVNRMQLFRSQSVDPQNLDIRPSAKIYSVPTRG